MLQPPLKPLTLELMNMTQGDFECCEDHVKVATFRPAGDYGPEDKFEKLETWLNWKKCTCHKEENHSGLPRKSWLFVPPRILEKEEALLWNAFPANKDLRGGPPWSVQLLAYLKHTRVQLAQDVSAGWDPKFVF